ncbi:TPA: hypothetical protein HJY57_002161 [Escherichia coli]|nr:hypothetical protein [Escherichia coli]
MSNTLNHTSSRQIVRHYTHRQKRRKHLMQYFVSANGLFELKVKVYAFLFDVILQGNCRSVSIIADIPCFFFFTFTQSDMHFIPFIRLIGRSVKANG